MFKRSKSTFIIIITLSSIIATLWLRSDWEQYWNSEQQFQIQEFKIKAGATGNEIIKALEQKGIIKSSFYLKFWLKLHHKKSSFKQGTYEFIGKLNLKAIIQKLINGDEKLFSAQIIPGWTFQHAINQLKKNPHLQNDLQNINLIELLHLTHSTEGWIFPDTYHFPDGFKLSKLLILAKKRMAQILDSAWQQKDETVRLSNSYDMLILASIVEKETSLKSEKNRIAGAFLLRLQKHMRLQTDPTVIYGIGAKFNGNITRKDLLNDNPYNTYTRFGLTPTPIALPDKSSIMAVAHPEITDKLYFVADGSGGHSFSATLEEHNKKVRKYLLNKKKK